MFKRKSKSREPGPEPRSLVRILRTPEERHEAAQRVYDWEHNNAIKSEMRAQQAERHFIRDEISPE